MPSSGFDRICGFPACKRFKQTNKQIQKPNSNQTKPKKNPPKNHVLLKTQLEKNSFKMLKLALGGDKDTNSPFYFRTEAIFNLPDAPMPSLIVCRMTHKLWVIIAHYWLVSQILVSRYICNRESIYGIISIFPYFVYVFILFYLFLQVTVFFLSFRGKSYW